MTDIAISVFNVSNRRGYFLPSLNIHYQEVEGPQLVGTYACARARVTK